MSTNRLEAFSDGVIAVAITLLVLDIKVPVAPQVHLGHALGQEWPHYAAYVVSFITIGIIWVNHHVMIGRLRQADHKIMLLNLLLLMSIAVLPFATALMAAFVDQSHGQHLAAAVFSGSFLAMAIFFWTLNRHILFEKPHLLAVDLSRERRRQILVRSFTGVIPYALATALAPVSPYITLGICAALATYYAFPIGSGGVSDSETPPGA